MSFAARPFAACGLSSGEAAEARDHPRPKEIEIIASAVTARSVRAHNTTEDRSLVILVVLLCPSGMARIISQDYRYGFPATIKHSSRWLIGAVFLIFSFRAVPAPAGQRALSLESDVSAAGRPVRPEDATG
jgi:hypothetical protein